MKKITSIVLNNFINDSRVLKENISLKNAGYSPQVVALHEGSLEIFEKITYLIRLKEKNLATNLNALLSLS